MLKYVDAEPHGFDGVSRDDRAPGGRVLRRAVQAHVLKNRSSFWPTKVSHDLRCVLKRGRQRLLVTGRSIKFEEGMREDHAHAVRFHSSRDLVGRSRIGSWFGY